jgi:hypothetical protein
MSLLAGLTTSKEINNEADNLGAGVVLETDLYESTITMAFLNKSKNGALGLNLHFKNADNREFRQTLWIASGDAKGNKNYYENKQGEKNYLPGFLHADAICLLTNGKGIAEMDTENKVVNVYSPEDKAEMPTQVEVLVDLLNEEIIIGLQKQVSDKNIQNDDGVYVPSGETREENEIDKIFRAKDGMTTAEIRAGAKEAKFVHSWKEKWEGKTRDRSTKGAGGGARSGAPARPGGAQAAGKQRASLWSGAK